MPGAPSADPAQNLTGEQSATDPSGAAPRALARAGSPQSVTRVIRILELLCRSEGAVSLADLARALATPKSSLSALLRGLADEGFVTAADGAWRLGPGAFGLGSALLEARRQFSSSDLVRAGLRRLAERSGETVLLALRDTAVEASPGNPARAGTITYVEVIESRNAVRFAVAVGDRRPLWATAGGRALLAAAPEAETTAYLDSLRPEKLTVAANALTSREGLKEAIARVRAEGVAQTIDQAADGVTGTAAVVRDAAGQILGAAVVAAPSARAGAPGRLAELRALVLEESAAISRSLGHR